VRNGAIQGRRKTIRVVACDIEPRDERAAFFDNDSTQSNYLKL